MNRLLKILVILVSLILFLFIALFVAAYLKPKHNQIAVWRTNLDQIYSAKQIWEGNETNKSPTFNDLRPFLSGSVTNRLFQTNGQLVDPNGGIYTIGRIGESPSCLINGVQKSLHDY
jgi:hypothetical protein